jgi:hypothetical protein
LFADAARAQSPLQVLVEHVSTFPDHAILVEHDLFGPAFARRSIEETTNWCLGFAQAGNRLPLFRIML